MALRRRLQKTTAPAPTTESLNGGELEWRDQQLVVAQLLARRYVADVDGLPDIGVLGATLDAWLDDDDTRVDINQVVNGLGIAVGQHVANATGLEWVIATDQIGSDLALAGSPGDILVFPANMIAKRLVGAERGFLRPLFDRLVADIEARRSLG